MVMPLKITAIKAISSPKLLPKKQKFNTDAKIIISIEISKRTVSPCRKIPINPMQNKNIEVKRMALPDTSTLHRHYGISCCDIHII